MTVFMLNFQERKTAPKPSAQGVRNEWRSQHVSKSHVLFIWRGFLAHGPRTRTSAGREDVAVESRRHLRDWDLGRLGRGLGATAQGARAHQTNFIGEKHMAIGIVRLRKESAVDRKQACLKYMQQRSTPITALELAKKLNMSAKTIHNSLWPLLDEGKIIRKRVKRQSSVSKRSGWAYGYTATEITPPTRNKKISWHNPFSL